MLRRIYRRCAGDVLRCKMPVQPALGYSVLMSDQPHRSKGCAARMREYPAPCRMISVQPTLHQAVSAERCTERCCDGQPKSCAGHHESCTIIAYFSGTCKPRRRFPPPFSATFRLSLPQPYRPSADGLCRGFPWVVFDSPHRSAVSVAGFRCCFRRQIPAAFAVARLGFSQVSSLRAFIKNRRRDFHRFPWGNEGAMEAAPPEAAPLLGRLCFLSVIDGVAPYQNLISNETAWIKAVSLVFLRSIAWHRAAAPVVCGSA